MEAAIAAFNPEMVAEFAARPGRVRPAIDPGRRRLARLVRRAYPRDDGTFANLATALALTDGGSEPPLGAWTVDRLGPPGAAVGSRPRRLVAGGLRGRSVPRSIPNAPATWPDIPGLATGVRRPGRARVPGRSAPVARRRLAERLPAPRLPRRRGRLAGLEDETLTATRDDLPSTAAAERRRSTRPGSTTPSPGRASWPAFAWAIDPAARRGTRLRPADRVERADPAHAGSPRCGRGSTSWPRRSRSGPRSTSGPTSAAYRGPCWSMPGASRRRHRRPCTPRAPRRPGGSPARCSRGSPPCSASPGARRPGGRAPRPPGRFGTGRCSSTVATRRSASSGASRLSRPRAAPTVRGSAASGAASPAPRFGPFWPGRLGAGGDPRTGPWPGPSPRPSRSLGRSRRRSRRVRRVRGPGLRGLVRRRLDSLPLDPPDRDRIRPRPMRLIDLHTDWILQYAHGDHGVRPCPLSRRHSAPGHRPRVTCRGPRRRSSPAIAATDGLGEPGRSLGRLGELLARIEAEFSGRLLIGPDDLARCARRSGGPLLGRDRCRGLRRPGSREPGGPRPAGPLCSTRGVRLFQPVDTPAALLAGSSAPGDDRGLTDLGAGLSPTLADLGGLEPSGPRPCSTWPT